VTISCKTNFRYIVALFGGAKDIMGVSSYLNIYEIATCCSHLHCSYVTGEECPHHYEWVDTAGKNKN
jgi:hypothetical protein